MAVPKHPELPIDYANFRTLEDAKWIRRSCGVRIQRRVITGKTDEYEQMRTMHAVMSARVRSDGLTLRAQYQYMRDQAFFTAMSSGIGVHLGSTNPPSTETTVEGYDVIDSSIAEGQPFYLKGLRVDNWNCQDHGDGTSTITVSLTQTSEWAAE